MYVRIAFTYYSRHAVRILYVLCQVPYLIAAQYGFPVTVQFLVRTYLVRNLVTVISVPGGTRIPVVFYDVFFEESVEK